MLNVVSFKNAQNKKKAEMNKELASERAFNRQIIGHLACEMSEVEIERTPAELEASRKLVEWTR